MYGRYGGDRGEIYGRYTGDMGEMARASSPLRAREIWGRYGEI
jgi:hypothetical protein